MGGIAKVEAGPPVQSQAIEPPPAKWQPSSGMAAIHPGGYTQAAHMLSGGDLRHDLAQITCPRTIASGSADTVTPPEGCQVLAQALAISYVSLGAVGHSCALEAGAAVNRLLGISGENI